MNFIIRLLFIVMCINVSNATANYLENANVKKALKETSYIKGAFEAQGILAFETLGVKINAPVLFLGIDDLVNQNTLIDGDFARNILNNYNFSTKKITLSGEVNDEKLQTLFTELSNKIKLSPTDSDNAILAYAMGIAFTDTVIEKYQSDWGSENYCSLGTRVISYNISDVLDGFKDTLDKKGRYTSLEIRKNSELYFTVLNQERLNSDQDFYKSFSQNPQTITTTTGLLYQLDRQSTSSSKNTIKITPNDQVTVNFNGKLINGCELIDTDGDPKIFRIGELTLGWQEALKLMNIGDKITIVVPPELGYGSHSFEMKNNETFVDSNALMVFEIELLDIQHAE